MFDGDMAKCRKPKEREEARWLRKQGEPFKRIAARLGVSSSTVHSWTRGIKLTPEQRVRNLRGPRGPQSPIQIARRTETWRRKHRERRRDYQEEGRQQAREMDPLHMAGCMLYWAEGAKQRNHVVFTNSDVAMLQFFVRFLRQRLGVKTHDCRIRLNVYTNNGLPLEEIERHWLHALGLPRSCIRGHTLNSYPTSSSGKRRKKLPYGVCSLTVARSTHLVQHIYGAIQEYAGFDEPRWLDGPPRKSQSGRRPKEGAQQDELEEAA
jgi:DNA-binding transcriptional MerR regulator